MSKPTDDAFIIYVWSTLMKLITFFALYFEKNLYGQFDTCIISYFSVITFLLLLHHDIAML